MFLLFSMLLLHFGSAFDYVILGVNAMSLILYFICYFPHTVFSLASIMGGLECIYNLLLPGSGTFITGII